MNFTPKMKEQALTAVILFWVKPRKGHEAMKQYSLDSEKNRQSGFKEPGIDRLIRKYVRRFQGEFRLAMIVDNQSPNRECLRVWNYLGEEEDPHKFNRK